MKRGTRAAIALIPPVALAIAGAAACGSSSGGGGSEFNPDASMGSYDAPMLQLDFDAAASSGSSGGQGTGGHDGGSSSGGPTDAGHDSGEGGKPPPSGAFAFGDGGACAHELTNPSCWTAYGLGGVHPVGGLSGGSFDGRYLYLASSSNSTNDEIRYDTMASFSAAASFTAFDTSGLAGGPNFGGAGFDGRYVYYEPCNPGFGAVLDRYDTQQAFGAAGSWTTFDMSGVDTTGSDGLCYIGVVYDGHYVYFVPNSIYEYWKGNVTRYDPGGALTDAGSWETFDTLGLSPYSAGFEGAAFDGRYIYFVPWGDGSTGTPIAIQHTPLFARYDTQASFTATGSWATFDPSPVGPTNAFVGAAFDGRYVYFAPGDYRGQATRYDTQASFTAAGSWSAFSMTSVSTGTQAHFAGVRFDGRYVYFIPTGSVLVRFDTQGTFSSAASWQAIDLTTLDPRAGSYHGGVFDGRYLYLVPTSSDLLLRFDAEPAGPLPAQSNASFF